MGVTVTATTTSGHPLSEENLERVLQAADMVLQLDADKLLILDLVRMRMHKIAPNLSEAVGEEIAARLMGVAGSLENLSKMPACNVQVSFNPFITASFNVNTLQFCADLGNSRRTTCISPAQYYERDRC